MVFPGFNNSKRSTINNGDWDRDGVSNRKDCEPLNFRKQGTEHDEKYDEEQQCECGRWYGKGELCKPCIKKYLGKKKK